MKVLWKDKCFESNGEEAKAIGFFPKNTDNPVNFIAVASNDGYDNNLDILTDKPTDLEFDRWYTLRVERSSSRISVFLDNNLYMSANAPVSKGKIKLRYYAAWMFKGC